MYIYICVYTNIYICNPVRDTLPKRSTFMPLLSEKHCYSCSLTSVSKNLRTAGEAGGELQPVLRSCLLFDNNRGLWMRAVCPCGGCVRGWGVSHVTEGLSAWAALDEGSGSGGEHEWESDPGAARLFWTVGYRDAWTTSSRSDRCWIILQKSGKLLDACLTQRTVRPSVLAPSHHQSAFVSVKRKLVKMFSRTQVYPC